MTSSEYLAQTLRRIQSERHMTYTEFAAFLGIGKSTLYNLLTGRGHFSSATLDQIADALDMPPHALIGGGEATVCLCKSVLHTSEAAARLCSIKRERAVYYLGQLIDLMA